MTTVRAFGGVLFDAALVVFLLIDVVIAVRLGRAVASIDLSAFSANALSIAVAFAVAGAFGALVLRYYRLHGPAVLASIAPIPVAALLVFAQIAVGD